MRVDGTRDNLGRASVKACLSHIWELCSQIFDVQLSKTWGLDLYAGWLNARMASHLLSHHPSLPTTSESGQQMLLFVIYTLRRKVLNFTSLALSNRKGKTVKVWKWPCMGLYKGTYSILIFRVRMIWMLRRARIEDLDNIQLYFLKRQFRHLVLVAPNVL